MRDCVHGCLARSCQICELRVERDAARDHAAGLVEALKDRTADVQRAEAAVSRLTADLLRYGQHDLDCPGERWVMVDGIQTTCDCGLEQALAGGDDQ